MEYKELLIETASKMVKKGKGILAADESNPTCGKRFESIGVDSTFENRNEYRDMLMNADGIENYKTIVNGDNKIKCISAASIIAKTYRDLLMIKLSEKFSNYAWESNFGYGTKAHLDGLKKYGVTSHHRKGFKPIHKILSN